MALIEIVERRFIVLCTKTLPRYSDRDHERDDFVADRAESIGNRLLCLG
jgi:hypothetical protein